MNQYIRWMRQVGINREDQRRGLFAHELDQHNKRVWTANIPKNIDYEKQAQWARCVSKLIANEIKDRPRPFVAALSSPAQATTQEAKT